MAALCGAPRGEMEEVGSKLATEEVGPALKNRRLKILWPATGEWYDADVQVAHSDGRARVWYKDTFTPDGYAEMEEIDLVETVRWGHVAWLPGENASSGITVGTSEGDGDDEALAADSFIHGFVAPSSPAPSRSSKRKQPSPGGNSLPDEDHLDAAEAPDEEEDAEWDPDADRPDDEVWEPALPGTSEDEPKPSSNPHHRPPNPPNHAPSKRKRGGSSNSSSKKKAEPDADRHVTRPLEQHSDAERASVALQMRADDDARPKVKQRLQTALRKGEDECSQAEERNSDYTYADTLAAEVEEALFSSCKTEGRSIYSRAARRLLYNLDDDNNPQLRAKVVARECSTTMLPHMSSEQLAAPGQVSERQKARERAEKQVFLPDEERENSTKLRNSDGGMEHEDAGLVHEFAQNEHRTKALPLKPPSGSIAPEGEEQQAHVKEESGVGQGQSGGESNAKDDNRWTKSERGDTATGDAIKAHSEGEDGDTNATTSPETTTTVGVQEEASADAPVVKTFKREGPAAAEAQEKSGLFEVIVKLEGVYDTKLHIEPEKGAIITYGCEDLMGVSSGNEMTVRGRVKLQDATKFAHNVRTTSKSRELSIARVFSCKVPQDEEERETMLGHLQRKQRAAYVVSKDKVELYLFPPGEAANEISPGSADEPSKRMLGVLVHPATDASSSGPARSKQHASVKRHYVHHHQKRSKHQSASSSSSTKREQGSRSSHEHGARRSSGEQQKGASTREERATERSKEKQNRAEQQAPPRPDPQPSEAKAVRNATPQLDKQQPPQPEIVPPPAAVASAPPVPTAPPGFGGGEAAAPLVPQLTKEQLQQVQLQMLQQQQQQQQQQEQEGPPLSAGTQELGNDGPPGFGGMGGPPGFSSNANNSS